MSSDDRVKEFLQANVASFKGDLEKLRHERETWSSKLAALDTQISHIEDSYVRVSAALKAYENTDTLKTELKAKRGSMQSKIEQVQQAIDELQGEDDFFA